jgi:nitrite reductase/ring-hydroxylating ferredoxin subunit
MSQTIAIRPSRAVLSDGTPITALIDRERREVAQRVFADPEIYRLEQERIWARAWIVVGHESEIPKAGDYVTRRIADDPVILVRQRDGSIECLLNVCPHRGATVCRAEAGNNSVFRCLYHGWIFNADGTFRGAPFGDLMYPNGMDTARMGMRRARVETFAGIIFANWDERAPSLDDYLGDFRFYLNLMFNRTKHGLEVMGPPQRYVINANWKTASEQFAGDAWHANQLHRSLSELAGTDRNDPAQWQMYAPKVSTMGHGIICFDMRGLMQMITGGQKLSALQKLLILPPPGMSPNLVPELAEQFSAAELELLADTPPSNGGMFPNVGLWNATGVLADRTPGGFLSVRTHVPLGVDKFEFCMWVLVARDAPEELREQIRRNTSTSQGASGFVEGDDAEVWPGLTASARGYIGRQNTMKYWALAGSHPPEGWPGGGNVHTGFSMDDPQWFWWSRYFDYLTGEV